MIRTSFFTAFILMQISLAAQDSLPDLRLSSAAMHADFAYLRSKLEQTHPGLYMHQGRERMQGIMDSLDGTLDEPLEIVDFYGRIAFLIAAIGCEHSYANPGPVFDGLLQRWKMFPFQLSLAGAKPIVIVNGTTDRRVHPGDRVVSINGRPIDSIRNILHRYIPSDGFMLPSRDHFLSSMMFSVCYNEFIERPAEYRVVFETTGGVLVTGDYQDGLDFASINQRAIRNPVNKPVLEADKRGKKIRKKQLDLILDPSHAAAILTIRSFGVDKQVFRATIDGFFDRIAKGDVKELLIDLSYNGGGEEELAAYLMSYLISSPAQFMRREYLIDISDSIFALSNIPAEVKANKYAYIDSMKQGISLAKITDYSRELEPMIPKSTAFHGRVWLYVNGMTSSAASTFAAVAQSSGRAVIVGQETAGSFRGGGTVLGLDLTLPNSGIRVHSSLVYQEFATSGRDGNRGVIPDYPYSPGYKEMIGGNKEWKELIFKLAGMP